MLVGALGGAVAAWAVVRQIAGAAAGLVAAGLFTIAPAVGNRAAVVSADVPAVALVVAALAVAAAAGRRPVLGLGAGALAAAAVMVKLLAVPLLPAVLVALWAVRAPWRAYAYAVGGGVLVVVLSLIPYVGVIGPLWAGAAGIRGGARDVFGPGVAGIGVGEILALSGLAIAAGAGVFALRRAPREWWRERAPVLAMLAGGVLFCFLHRPLFAHHLVVVSVPLALLAASTWPRLRAWPLAVAGVAILLAPIPLRAREAPPDAFQDQERVAEIVRVETAPNESVISDLPLVPILAERPSPPETIDASYVRMGADPEAAGIVLAEARGAGAVVAGRAFLEHPDLLARLDARFPASTRVGDITVFYRGSPSGSSE